MKLSSKYVSKILTGSIIFGSLTFSPTFYDVQDLKLTSSVAHAKVDAAQIGKIINTIFKVEREFQKFKSARNKNKLSKDELYEENVNEAVGKDKTEAIRLLTEAIKIKPDRWEAYYRRSFKFPSGSEKALADLDKAIKLKPDYTNAYYVRALHYSIADNDSAALEDYSKTIELDPKNVDAYRERIKIYREFHNNADAIADCTKLMEFDDDIWLYQNRAVYYYDLSDYEHAIADFTKFFQAVNTNNVNNPKLHSSYNLLGNCYMAVGDTEKARAAFMMIM